MRTCMVSSFKFNQKFKWVADFAGNGALGVDIPAYGPCGIVQLDRFEANKLDSKILFWKYIAKKAITNPKGEFSLLGIKCSDLSQEEYIHNWKNETGNN